MTPDTSTVSPKSTALPCHFCGSERIVTEGIPNTNVRYSRCLDCGACGPRNGAWNSRAQPEAVDTITRAQARKLVEQALRSQSDPGEYTARKIDYGTGSSASYESLGHWKARALDLVLSRMADEPPAIQMSAEDVEKVREALNLALGTLLDNFEAQDIPHTFESVTEALSLLPVTPRQTP